MKVIGKGPYDSFICEISSEEIRKVLDKTYNDRPNIVVGGEINLAAGYDFRNDIKSACLGMTQAMERFGRAQGTLQKFAVMVAQLPNEEAP